MLIITSRIPSVNFSIKKGLARLVQGYIYNQLSPAEHVGYKHSNGKVFKRVNFDFNLVNNQIKIRFSSCEPKLEETLAMAILKDGLVLGEIHLVDTHIEFIHNLTSKNHVVISGFVACAITSLLGYKIYLEPQDSRHLEMMKLNALQRYETLMQKPYDGEFELSLKWQNLNRPREFYYKGDIPLKAWLAKWEIKAKADLINLLLSAGVGSGCMNYGCGFLEIEQE
ncbi:CRISPR/Cas system-associated RAMP protein Cas6, type I-B/HMARI [Campylobacter iguaniorum]|uniref:CRISPR/Cas system-associated RAMP protein Cas6, type I-B/HMARI n=1 Tax=Campylobacter iguaniorum TaxID=1244531 RepID=A0A076F9T2_9BACT|nr:CRISPR-associated endoribonuclease Cas6 [Campylobacter iguaniorum]AII14448.1 CRISPR/Cas system-associated RAMP protein Cas6, type I-B/HMARI [Campylobacter iguaniorum]ALV24183.1 CRISPR/Cas system-associated RAMP protein Cas6, type I-B/HMARI [Campylobacter iguaniorum]